MNRTTRKASRTFKKILGNKAYAVVRKNLKQFKNPLYAESLNYQRAGAPIVLRGNADYYKLYPDTKNNFFIHHMPDPYYYLLTHSEFLK